MREAGSFLFLGLQGHRNDSSVMVPTFVLSWRCQASPTLQSKSNYFQIHTQLIPLARRKYVTIQIHQLWVWASDEIYVPGQILSWVKFRSVVLLSVRRAECRLWKEPVATALWLEVKRLHKVMSLKTRRGCSTSELGLKISRTHEFKERT